MSCASLCTGHMVIGIRYVKLIYSEILKSNLAQNQVNMNINHEGKTLSNSHKERTETLFLHMVLPSLLDFPTRFPRRFNRARSQNLYLSMYVMYSFPPMLLLKTGRSIYYRSMLSNLHGAMTRGCTARAPTQVLLLAPHVSLRIRSLKKLLFRFISFKFDVLITKLF